MIQNKEFAAAACISFFLALGLGDEILGTWVKLQGTMTETSQRTIILHGLEWLNSYDGEKTDF